MEGVLEEPRRRFTGRGDSMYTSDPREEVLLFTSGRGEERRACV